MPALVLLLLPSAVSAANTNVAVYFITNHDQEFGARPCSFPGDTDVDRVYNLIISKAPKVSTSYTRPAPLSHDASPDDVIKAAERLQPIPYGVIVAALCQQTKPGTNPTGETQLTAEITATVLVPQPKATPAVYPGTTLTGVIFPAGQTIPPAGNPPLQAMDWSQLWPPNVPVYLYPTKAIGTTPCQRPTSEQLDAVYNMILNNAPAFGAIYRRPSSPPVDPIVDASNSVLLPIPSATIIADVCSSGTVVNASVTGYQIQRDNTGKISQIVSGKTLTGAIDALESDDWSPLYVNPSYAGVGYLPIAGDSADTINNYVEHALPFQLTVISDVNTATGLCTSTGSSMLIVGQGSLATQVLDPFRLIVGAAGFSLTSPTPWVTAEKFGLAALGLALVPAKQNIAVDVLDCYDGGLYRMVNRINKADGTADADAEKNEQTLHVIGHSRRYGWGTSDPAAARLVLDNAVYDLEWQITCVVYSRMTESNTITNARQANSPTPLPRADYSADPACQAYYSHIGWSQVYSPILVPVNRSRARFGENAITAYPRKVAPPQQP